jgi:hypothetical protein
MATHYVVLQYLPNPASGERVNIGIIAYNDTGGVVRFLSRWERVRAFAGSDVSFLKELTQAVVARVDSLTAAVRNKFVEQFQASDIERWASRWSHSVEFTPPRASTLAPERLLNDLCGRLLTDPAPEKKVGRDRAAAARVAIFGLREALGAKVGDKAEKLLRRNYRLEGKHQRHKFDAGVANGVPYAVAMGLSFEGVYTERNEKLFDSLAWAVSDVAVNAQAIPVAVVALPPVDGTPGFEQQVRSYEQKQKLYTELGATFISEADYPKWASRFVETLPLNDE